MDIRDYDQDRQDIQNKMEHEYIFLDSFRELFFDDKGAGVFSDKLPASLTNDIIIILTSLRKKLSEYGILAAKHCFLEVEIEGHIKRSTGE